MTELDKVRERNSKLEKALRELVDYGGTLSGWDDARSHAKRILAEVSGQPTLYGTGPAILQDLPIIRAANKIKRRQIQEFPKR